LGLSKGQIIQEFGWGEDVDESLRQRIESTTEEELVAEDYADVADGALVWWREEDGDVDDLSDLLMDARGNLDNGSGIIWVMIPAPGEPGHVAHNDVEDAASAAGLSATTAASLGEGWAGVRLTARGRGK